jgi:hypothetical protein
MVNLKQATRRATFEVVDHIHVQTRKWQYDLHATREPQCVVLASRRNLPRASRAQRHRASI